jgi:hypothetical protein
MGLRTVHHAKKDKRPPQEGTGRGRRQDAPNGRNGHLRKTCKRYDAAARGRSGSQTATNKNEKTVALWNAGTIADRSRAPEQEVQPHDLNQVVGVIVIKVSPAWKSATLYGGSEEREQDAENEPLDGAVLALDIRSVDSSRDERSGCTHGINRQIPERCECPGFKVGCKTVVCSSYGCRNA